MREHTIKLFTFDELSQEAKEIAIERYRNNMDLDTESMMISESFTEILDDKGYPTENLEWSLSHSQGDGVAFYGWVEIEKVANRLLDGRKLELFSDMQKKMLTLDANIIRNTYGYRYSHSGTMAIETDGDDIETMIEFLFPEVDEEENRDLYYEKYREIQELIEYLGNAILSDVQETSKELERIGYESLDYYYSDEYIEEKFRANDYEFTSDGKVFN